MKKIVSFFVISLILVGFSYASDMTYKFEFVRDYIHGLGLLKSSFVDSATAIDGNYANVIQKGSAIMASAASQIYNLKMAKNLLRGYQNSPDELVREVTKNALFAYGMLEDINMESSKNFKRMHSPEVLNNPSQFNQGEEMEKIGKLRADQEQALLLLIDTSKLAPGVLISKAQGDEGKMNYLVITLEQKNELLQKLLDDFGDKVKVNKEDFKSAGLATIDLSGWVIYNTLNQSYKTVEDRPNGFVEPNNESFDLKN